MEEREVVQINNEKLEGNPAWDFFKESSDEEDCDNGDIGIIDKNIIDRRKMLRSNIWKLYDVTDLEERLALCKLCKHEFSYKSSTSNLFKHLKRMHLDDYYRMKEDSNVSNGTDVGNSYETIEKTPSKFRPKRSVGWKYFSLKSKAKSLAKCKICKQILSYRASISNLTKHVKRKHKEFWQDASLVEDGKSSEDEEVYESTPQKVRSRLRTSTAWKHFEVLGDDNSQKARCKLCGKVLSYSSSVSNLKSHLMKTHGIDYKRFSYDSNDDEGAADENNDNEKSKRESRQRPRTSKAWDYFDVDDESKKMARCKICDALCSYMTSVTNLMKHVRQKHSDSLQLAIASSDEGSVGSNNNEEMSEADSMVWLYFKNLDARLRIASCLLCQKRIDYATLLDLQRHLVRKHAHIKLPEGRDATSKHIIADDGQLYEIAKQEIDDDDDDNDDNQNELIEMDTLYLEDPIEEVYTQRRCKKEEKHKTKPYKPNPPDSSDEDTYKKQKERKSDIFDNFGTYIASLMRQLPKERSDQLQIAFVKQIMDAKLTGSMKKNVLSNIDIRHTPASAPTDVDMQEVTSYTLADSRGVVPTTVCRDTDSHTECDTHIIVTPNNASKDCSIAVTKLPDLS